jgi:8-amino-7-oxononanoate synthase
MNPREHARAIFLETFDGLLDQVAALQQTGRYAFFPCFEEIGNGCGRLDGNRQIVFVANNYLGLAGDPRVKRAAQEAIESFGTSACASPLAGGYTRIHRELEDQLADCLEREAATLFASGYQANLGTIAALMRPEDLIVSDLFNHASIVDGARLSGADFRYFNHNDAQHLELLLRKAGRRRVLVVLEGVYSVDGDIARLADLCTVAHRHGALVMVDEAHSFGVLGEGGRGAAEHFGLLHEVDIIMGTMSKSLGGVGGFVVGDRNLIDVVRHNARSLIFSAALPPAGAAASLVALDLLRTGGHLRRRLWDNASFLLDGLRTRGFDTMQSETPVVVIRAGLPEQAIEFTARLREHGVLVCPVIPPLVQGHLSRVRAHVTASHDRGTLAEALEVITQVGQALGIPAAPADEDRRLALPADRA